MADAKLTIVDAETTAACLPYRALIDVLRGGFKTGCIAPVRHHHQMQKHREPDATLLLMPAWSNSEDHDQFLGVKLVTVVPGNTARGLPGLTSTYVLYDATTGQQLALMDGNVITARRTVATSALAAQILARDDAKSLLVIGAGRVASQLPDAYRAIRPIHKVMVWDIDPVAASRLAHSLNERGFASQVAMDLEQAAASADIISAATLSTTPLIKGAWMRKGTHVDLIGGFTPTMREADDATLLSARAFVDTLEALHEAGDLVQPLQSGLISEAHILGTLTDLIKGQVTGRRSSDEITYFKSVGSALADLVTAQMVYQRIT
ncbi:ornithine cyclodeaminase family protein [Rhizobium freirei]|nr:ornithine cyclodeaminase family protein [Rhizobium freirei]